MDVGQNPASANSGDPYANLRAGPSITRSLVRFYNKTKRVVDIYWVDYNGHHVLYCSLTSNGWFDVDTFVGHPWLFRDNHSGQSLITLPDKLYVFFPTPPRIPQPSRRVVVVGIPVLRLEEICIQFLRPIFEKRSEEQVEELEIPICLQQRLKKSILSSVGYRVTRAQPLAGANP